MSDPSDMPRIDLKKDENLKREAAYAKHVEAKNFVRSLYAKRMLRKHRTVATLCWLSVIGAYAYSIAAISQETFLDDFEEPPRRPVN